MRHSARRWVTVPLIAMAAVGFTAVVTGCGHKAVIQCEAKAPDPPPPAQPDPPPPPPAPPPPAPVADKIIIPGELEFASGSAQIRESTSSLDTLNSVSRLMTDHPEVTKLRIEGHTDDVGYPDYNMRLSQKRADAVRWWLVSRGIDPTRLVTVGYGQMRPIVTNDSTEHRRMNRRTEFHVQELDGKPYGDDTAYTPPTASTAYAVPQPPTGG